jgi:hypothetical protein
MNVRGCRDHAFHSLFHFEVLLVCDCFTVKRRVCGIAAGENFLSFCLVFLNFLLRDSGYTWDSLTLEKWRVIICRAYYIIEHLFFV